MKHITSGETPIKARLNSWLTRLSEKWNWTKNDLSGNPTNRPGGTESAWSW
jgi:hypothetical protein